jgi:hypothetical protein
VNAGRSVQHHVADLHADDLRDSGAGVVHEGEQQAITLADPAGAGLADHCQHLFAREEAEHGPLEALHRHAQCLLDHLHGGDIPTRRELQECAQRRQPGIAAAHRVVTLTLQVV